MINNCGDVVEYVGSDCGHANGYKYRYRFYMDEDIIRRCSCLNIREDVKFLFQFQTNFRVGGEGGGGGDEIIDSERFEIGAQSCDEDHIFRLMCLRLEDYWFDGDGIVPFIRAASDFACAQEQGLGGRVIPIGVELDICAVPVYDESMGEVADRAMRSDDLFPSWLMWERNAFVNVERPPYRDVLPWLRSWGGDGMETERVFCPEFYPRCFICGRSPRFGEEYTILKKYCGHTFHYRCLVLSLIAQTGHTFHYRCLVLSLIAQTSCPICSHTILPSTLIPLQRMNMITLILVSSLSKI